MKNLANHPLGHPTSAAAPVSLKLKIWTVLSRKPKAIIVILLSVSLLLQSQFINAQAPQQFSFQGVARDASVKIAANTKELASIQEMHKTLSALAARKSY